MPIFGDTLLEVMHERDGEFIQLFAIQFHTFFLINDLIRFSKSQIDLVSNDDRYQDDFFIELVVDQERSVELNTFDVEVSSWKALMSDFFVNIFDNKEEEAKAKEEVKKEVSVEKAEDDEEVDDYLKGLEEREV